MRSCVRVNESQRSASASSSAVRHLISLVLAVGTEEGIINLQGRGDIWAEVAQQGSPAVSRDGYANGSWQETCNVSKGNGVRGS